MARSATQGTGDRRSSSPDVEIDVETLRLVQRYLRACTDRTVVHTELVAAWDRFYSACDPLIHQLALRRPAQDADEQDRSQEMWRAVITHLAQYDPARGFFSRWLKKVIRHVLVDQARSRARLGGMERGRVLHIISLPCDPADPYEFEDARRRVRLAMAELRAHLSVASYQIVHEHWFEGKSLPEIAVALGLKVKPVRDRHHRAMVKLRDLLSRKT